MPKILVVDDEDEVRAAISRRLEREGFSVTVAASSAEAASVIKSQEAGFDVIVTDMSMEETNSGLVVLKEALMNDVFTEVIVLTAYGNVTNAVESMRNGAFDYLEKNIPGIDVYELLVLKVEMATERRRSSMNTIRRLEVFAANQA